MEEIELLRAYAQTRSDAAFEELTRRYVNLVYSSALRQVRNAALAEDVTQATFLVLARKAHRLRADVPLSSWLLTVTRYAAKDALKSASRRTRHELKAAAMKSETTAPAEMGETETRWEEVAPLLDEAVGSLSGEGRTAIVLRYFEQKSYSEVARAMGITEVTARQRVARAIERLRAFFSGQGIVLSAISLKAMIRTQAVAPAPATVSTASALMGSKGAVLSARHVALAHAATAAMIPIALKWGVLTALIVVVAAALAIFQTTRPIAVIAPPDASPVVSLTGSVVTADGKPVGGAEVLLAQSSAPVAVYGTQRDGVLAVRTNSDGAYELPFRADATSIVVRADQGYAQVLVNRGSLSPQRIVLMPWGRITGTLRAAGKPRPGQTLELTRTGAQAGDWERWHVMHEMRTQTDQLGRFVFERVSVTGPNDSHGTAIRWISDGNSWSSRSFAVAVAPGKTADIILGGSGAMVRGQIDSGPRKIPPFYGTLAPIISRPATRPAQSALQPSGRSDASAEPITFTASPDDSFSIEDVPPGTYQLDLRSWLRTAGSNSLEEVAAVYTHVTVPSTASSEQTIDLGTLTAHLNPILLPGDHVPDFFATVIDETKTELRLSQLRGKVVLLYVEVSGDDVGATTDSLKPVFDRFASNPRFAIVELSGTSLFDRFRWFQLHQQLPWTVANLRLAPSTRPSTDSQPSGSQVWEFGRQRLLVIDADGRLLATCGRARDTYAVIDRALGRGSRDVTSHVDVERASDDAAPSKPFKKLPNPTDTGNLARAATFFVADGVIGRISGGIDVLHDGMLPDGNDQPMENFSFDWGTLEGRICVDLGRPEPVARISTYSWHRSDRAPQVYRVFGSDGHSPHFELRPKIGTDPSRCGWKHIADVDSRPAGKFVGGRYTASIGDRQRALGSFRYLLFETFVTESADDWGHTFFSEIDIMRYPEEEP